MRMPYQKYAFSVPVMIVSVFTISLVIHALGFRFVVSRSVPRGLYQAITLPLERGTLVAFCLSPALATFATTRGYVPWGTCPGGTQPVVKLIGAVAGDIVDVQPDGVLVNGERLPNSATLARDSRGRTLPHVPWGRYLVTENEFWLFSTHIPESWDSRYFGPVSRTQILSTARAIWTLTEEETTR